MEKIMIEGNLGKDAAYSIPKYPDALRFSVGVAQGSKEEKKPTVWYDVVCWKKEESEKLVLKLKKGSRVIVTGKPILRTWKDAEGNAKGQISINAYQVDAVNPKTNSGEGNVAQKENDTSVYMEHDDEVPF